ncbi:LamB/YcsF family protein [Metallumcola ferriviriculae]|uniref:5-oxoprolinase subunit A n=1 Tax=Metallumcola ferriviriculae TaxID=3039180 RepID=A0AAU0UQS4_9FIRM|nr:LamB/YcsF family protein [Desulfitibacteraceae bacterium MK1]
MNRVDLNSDIGESFGNYKIGNDEVVLRYVTSVNIACGFHAGDPQVMEFTVKKALENNVAVGAHPGFPDLMGFGRRNMVISPEEAKAYIIYQVGALNGFVRAYGGKLQHVKPHGALYNMAARDYTLARAIAEGVYLVDCELILMGLSGSQLIKAGQEVGLQTASEVFADRAYTAEGTLVPRGTEGAVIHNKTVAASRVLRMIQAGKVTTLDGKTIDIKADSICVHGDNQEAVALVEHIKKVFQDAGVKVTALNRK